MITGEYPIFDYEKILCGFRMSVNGSFKDKLLFVKKATGLGVTGFMLRIMAWLCTRTEGWIKAFVGTDTARCA
jgi:hypothetical protein